MTCPRGHPLDGVKRDKYADGRPRERRYCRTCAAANARKYRAPKLLRRRGPRPRSLAERLWPKIDKRGPDECWLWKGSLARGYGRIGGPDSKKVLQAHRVAYELLVGPIPHGLELDHLCTVRACCNPAHLEPVTGEENKRRARARRTIGIAR